LLGYDEGSMHMAAFDWRLSLDDLELRDKYFTKLKVSIEMLKETNGGEKVVVVAHSMGSNVFYYFMQWVSAGNGFTKPVGKGDRDWFEIMLNEKYFNI
jgi:phospholipid:diacylglycerol acyltransferase